MHGYADGLSRLPLTAVGDENPYEDVSVFNMSQIESCPVIDSDIRCATLSDSVSNVLKFTQQGWPREVGLPVQLVSNNGPQFISTEFAEFLEGNEVKHIRSAPYHPPSCH